jgi:Uma2 family endonuclease
MSHALVEKPYDWDEIIENLVTEDDEPVDNLYSAKQQRLLARTIYSSWIPPQSEGKHKKRRKFLADVNVGLFYAIHEPPMVPDMFLSLDVEPHEGWLDKEHRSYFIWEFGKAPEVVVEIVSNRKGHELDKKLKDYARMGVTYYVVHGPKNRLSEDTVRVYEIGFGKRYRLREDLKLPEVELSLTLWKGVFEGLEDTWLRWVDADGNLIPTGEERAVRAEGLVSKAEERAVRAEAEVERLHAELEKSKRAAAKKPAKKRTSK